MAPITTIIHRKRLRDADEEDEDEDDADLEAALEQNRRAPITFKSLRELQVKYSTNCVLCKFGLTCEPVEGESKMVRMMRETLRKYKGSSEEHFVAKAIIRIYDEEYRNEAVTRDTSVPIATIPMVEEHIQQHMGDPIASMQRSFDRWGTLERVLWDRLASVPADSAKGGTEVSIDNVILNQLALVMKTRVGMVPLLREGTRKKS